MQPWFPVKQFEVVRSDVELLVDAMYKYKSFLTAQNEKVQSKHLSLTQIRPIEDCATLVTLPAKSHALIAEHKEVEQKMLNLSLYQPLCPNDIMPTE